MNTINEVIRKNVAAWQASKSKAEALRAFRLESYRQLEARKEAGRQRRAIREGRLLSVASVWPA